MEQITVTLPAVDESVIAALETETVVMAETETKTLEAIRRVYGPFARHAGDVKIGWSFQGSPNYSREQHYYYRRADNRRVKALLAVDGFDRQQETEFTGRFTGSRLYLLEDGRWLLITRDGNWSRWQNAPEEWACGDDILPGSDSDEYDTPRNRGSISILTDAEVQARHALTEIVSGLSESLRTLAGKLPERLTKVRSRCALATELLGKLQEVK